MGGQQTVDKNSEEELSHKYNHRQYIIRGFARTSKSGKALNLIIIESDGNHLLSISKADIIDAFEHGSQCCAIEYQLSDAERKELKHNGS